MFCDDSGLYVPRSTITRIPNITLSDYIRKFEEKVGEEPFLSAMGIDWSTVFFDLTASEEMLEKEKNYASFLEVHVSSCDIVSILGTVFYQKTQRQREKSKQAKEFLENVLKKEGQARVSVLSAHGTMVNQQWQYLDYGRPVAPVQDWIIKESAQKGTEEPNILLISCCNPYEFVPIVQGIPLLYPVGKVGNSQDHAYFVRT